MWHGSGIEYYGCFFGGKVKNGGKRYKISHIKSVVASSITLDICQSIGNFMLQRR